MVKKQKRLGELLIDAGLITRDQLNIALERQKSWGDRLGANLIVTGALSEGQLQLFLAKSTGIEEFDLASYEIAREIAMMIPHKVAEQFNLIPLRVEGKNTLLVACADPTDLNALDQISFITGHKVIPVISSYSSIVQAINRYILGYGAGDDHDDSPFERHSETKVKDFDDTESLTQDPDIIIFDGNHRPVTKKSESPEPKETLPESAPSTEPEENRNTLDEALGFDFGRPLLKYAAEKAMPAVGPSLDTSQFSFEQKMKAVYQVMIRKGLITEQEINSELMRMWSLGELK